MTLRYFEGSPVDWELIIHSCIRPFFIYNCTAYLKLLQQIFSNLIKIAFKEIENGSNS